MHMHEWKKDVVYTLLAHGLLPCMVNSNNLPTLLQHCFKDLAN